MRQEPTALEAEQQREERRGVEGVAEQQREEVQRGGKERQQHGGVHQQGVNERGVLLQREDAHPGDGEAEGAQTAQDAELKVEAEDDGLRVRGGGERHQQEDQRHAAVLDGHEPCREDAHERLAGQHQRDGVEERLAQDGEAEERAACDASSEAAPEQEADEQQQTPHDEARFAGALQLLRLHATHQTPLLLLLLATAHTTAQALHHALKHLRHFADLPVHLHAQRQLVLLPPKVPLCR